MATKREVERKLRELIRRLNQADSQVQESLARTLPESRIVEVTVTDLEAIYWTELSEGRMGPLHESIPRQAEIRVRVSGDHLVELVDGHRSLFSSYLGGQVKIEASLSDLLRLRRLG